MTADEAVGTLRSDCHGLFRILRQNLAPARLPSRAPSHLCRSARRYATLPVMWRGNEDVLVTDLDDELVLMHAGRSEMFSLNAAGRLLWQALPASEETLTDLLRRTFDLSGTQAQVDVRAVLQDLAARDLIRKG